MPRDLKPAIIAFPHALQKGALILLPRPAPAKGKAAPAGAGAGGSTTGTQLRFQYNPETVTRARSGAWEARKTQKGSSKGSGGPTAPQNQTLEAFQGGGLYAKSETLTIKLIFDATEFLLSAPPGAGAPAPNDDRSLGILPELAVLERMAIANPRSDEKDAGTKPAGKDSKLDAVVPSELLLVLGARAFPVVITSMTISEKRFSPTLVPLRAEIDLQMQLLESHEVEGNQPIKAAYDQLRTQREENAAKAAESVTVGNDGKLDAINQALSQKFDAGGV
ncbi:MAG TPA: hypothetical protein VMG12_06155 [Polyangiaceae bacterium]|nr:hypothetical protein [Polyangiaceae bacterium]